MKSKTRAYIRLSLLFASIVLLSILLMHFGRSTFLDAEWLENLPCKMHEYKSYAFLVLTGLQFLQILICLIPGEPIQIASSYLYGIVPGYLISIIGAFFGAIAAYKLAELIGKNAVHQIFGEEKVEEYRKRLNSGRSMAIVLIIYIIPGIPKDFVAYVAGISEMKLVPFLILSTIGRSPGILGSLIMGVLLESKNYVVLAVLFTVACLITIACIIKSRQILSILDRFAERYGDTDG